MSTTMRLQSTQTLVCIAHSWQAKKRWPKIWLIQSIRKCECSIQQIKNKICCLWVNHSINLFNAHASLKRERGMTSHGLFGAKTWSEDGFDQSHTREDALMEVASERIFFFSVSSAWSLQTWTLAEAQLAPFSHLVSLGDEVFSRLAENVSHFGCCAASRVSVQSHKWVYSLEEQYTESTCQPLQHKSAACDSLIKRSAPIRNEVPFRLNTGPFLDVFISQKNLPLFVSHVIKKFVTGIMVCKYPRDTMYIPDLTR